MIMRDALILAIITHADQLEDFVQGTILTFKIP